MLVVLEAAGMLIERNASEFFLASRRSHQGSQDQISEDPTPGRLSRLVSHLASAVTQGAARLGAWVQRVRERRQIVQSLSAMDDRLLADIGITREQIPEVAAAALERGPSHPVRLLSPGHWWRRDAVAAGEVANDNERRLAA